MGPYNDEQRARRDEQTRRAIDNTKARHERWLERCRTQPAQPSLRGPEHVDPPTAPAQPTPRQILIAAGRSALRITAAGLLAVGLIVASDHTTILDGLLAVALEPAR